MIFLDAAGTSNPKHEPYVVIAGVIIHGDQHWKAIGDHLSALADKYAPPDRRKNFAFHATELFSGGKVFPRDKYSKEWRWAVLDEIVAIPKRFGIPVVWGHVPRKDVEPGGPLSAHDGLKPVIQAQLLCFVTAMGAADKWMVANADNEIATAVMENDHETRSIVEFTHRAITDPSLEVHSQPELNLSRIVYPIHFERKTDSSALQVADACAFALKRIVMGTPECSRFVEPLQSQLSYRFKSQADFFSMRAAQHA